MQTLVYPMAALVFFTFLVLFSMLVMRINAVRGRKISPRYFKLNKGAKVPDNLSAISECYNNLLQLPVLFYLACLLAMVLNKSSEYLVVLAWAYVVLRYIHAIILISYNHILHRLLVFAFSCIVLIAMWAKLILLL